MFVYSFFVLICILFDKTLIIIIKENLRKIKHLFEKIHMYSLHVKKSSQQLLSRGEGIKS